MLWFQAFQCKLFENFLVPFNVFQAAYFVWRQHVFGVKIEVGLNQGSVWSNFERGPGRSNHLVYRPPFLFHFTRVYNVAQGQ
jgi:hypothetical protein